MTGDIAFGLCEWANCDEDPYFAYYSFVLAEGEVSEGSFLCKRHALEFVTLAMAGMLDDEREIEYFTVKVL